jgi:pyrroloquinoline quinone biosynthesis protein D
MNEESRLQGPRIRRGFRLQWEAAQNAHVLLYPEGMVKLNRSAGEILSRCNGELSVEQIAADLQQAFSRDDLLQDVRDFLAHANQHGWIEVPS